MEIIILLCGLLLWATYFELIWKDKLTADAMVGLAALGIVLTAILSLLLINLRN